MPIPLIAAGIAAGANVGGQWMANRANTQLAREQMAFQERMSSTAYQRATQDMKEAGLNPALMYGSASAASSPVGARPEVRNVMGNISSAGQMARDMAQLKVLDAQARKAELEGDVILPEAEAGREMVREHPDLKLTTDHGVEIVKRGGKVYQDELDKLVEARFGHAVTRWEADKIRNVLLESEQAGALNLEQIQRQISKLPPELRTIALLLFSVLTRRNQVR